MPNLPTPGQLCYEAYLATWRHIPGLRTWHDEPLFQQRAWEAAAQAVLDRHTIPQEEPHGTTQSG